MSFQTVMFYQRNYAALQERRAFAAQSSTVLSPKAQEFIRQLHEKDLEHERELVARYEARLKQL